MKDVYKECPSFENARYCLRFVDEMMQMIC